MRPDLPSNGLKAFLRATLRRYQRSPKHWFRIRPKGSPNWTPWEPCGPTIVIDSDREIEIQAKTSFNRPNDED